MGQAKSNAAAEASEAAKETARAEVFRLTGLIFSAEDSLAAERNKFNQLASDASKQLRGTIETPYSKGDDKMASKLHAQAVKDLEAQDQVARDRKEAIDPISEDLTELRKNRKEAFVNINQGSLAFDTDDGD